ncbi:hypothetical protein [Paucibacter sp. Y2R2-4]|uniref:DUF3885 domain-containing protein n=1 Tax=Paucibacter sp. Y2R2-4 TaxID=2893553 RepID=UPI0021E396D7|nr:hypothetical protein [Paucibacter sp. Y2R2-4]MCV2349495.1 hypothetical protein [Paucibacter sp. Y2R2-4]
MQPDPLAWWESTFGSIAPVGHALRRYLPSNWTRFHSLPESKRYPDSKSEVEEIVSRHTQVAAELFAPGEPLYAFQSRYSTTRRKLKEKRSISGRQLRQSIVMLPVNTGAVAREDDDILVTRALVTTWKPDFFDRLVREVANEQESLVAFAAPGSQNVYCPYDGGMDIFVFSTTPVQLEKKFPNWLSDRQDKL